MPRRRPSYARVVAVLPAVEIYRYALLAGFTPDQAVTMTAVALAESGGQAGANNTVGEDSRGLWQINAAVHPQFDGQDLFDPLTNARAAFDVSRGGDDISPWTTTHGEASARYLGFRDEAELAARLAGDDPDGMWAGTPGYGYAAPAGGGAGDAGVAAGTETSDALSTFLSSATAQEGDPYVWGATVDMDDPDPDAFDCSELVRWAASQAGVEVSDGTWLQYLDLKEEGTTMSVEEAIDTPGALLFRFSTEPVPGGGRPSSAHVAISLGDGRTIEAAGRRTGVIYGDANNGFTQAASIPGLSDGTGGAAVMAAFGIQADGTTAVDTDRDGLVDSMEASLGLDAIDADSDSDGISDGYEMLRTGSDPLLADTEGDGVGDSVELSRGTSPVDPDTDRDGVEDGATGPVTDVDLDGLSDRLEEMLGTSTSSADSDGDGFVDGAEYLGEFDPTDAASSPLAVPVTGTGAVDDPSTGTDLAVTDV